MHRLIRNSHLLLGLFSVFFLLTYAVSAVQMAHGIPTASETHDASVTAPPGLEPRALANWLMDHRGYEGELGEVKPTPNGSRFRISRAGGNVLVTYDRASGQATLHETSLGFLGMLNRLHHFHGLQHETWAGAAWGWELFLVSLALILMGLSGIYLWFKIYKERAAGTILLAANLVISLVLLWSLRA